MNENYSLCKYLLNTYCVPGLEEDQSVSKTTGALPHGSQKLKDYYEVSKCSVNPAAPAFLAPGTGFVEDNLYSGWGEGRFRDDSGTLHLPHTLFLLS